MGLTQSLSLVALSAPLAALAQERPTMLDNVRRATALIDAAVGAHGGLDALRAARRMRVTMDGHEWHRHQSRSTRRWTAPCGDTN
ncbi:MAG TPA: hypothetical protein VEA99_07410 [Gemmatimonadaceae bacterium]|nr:hypothetical protein [Gemmatimonadaceae bacterium]